MLAYADHAGSRPDCWAESYHRSKTGFQVSAFISWPLIAVFILSVAKNPLKARGTIGDQIIIGNFATRRFYPLTFLMTTLQEYAAVQTAIQTLTTTGQSVVSFSIGDMQVTYSQSQLPWLEKREETLARRINQRNVRKRTFSDFSGGSETSTLPV